MINISISQMKPPKLREFQWLPELTKLLNGSSRAQGQVQLFLLHHIFSYIPGDIQKRLNAHKRVGLEIEHHNNQEFPKRGNFWKRHSGWVKHEQHCGEFLFDSFITAKETIQGNLTAFRSFSKLKGNFFHPCSQQRSVTATPQCQNPEMEASVYPSDVNLQTKRLSHLPEDRKYHWKHISTFLMSPSDSTHCHQKNRGNKWTF